MSQTSKPDFVPMRMSHQPCWYGDESSKDKKLIVRVTGKNDRFGSQYSAQMSAYAFARKYNCTYRFTPFFGDKESKFASEFCGMKSDDDDDITRESEIRFHRHYDTAQDRNVDTFFTESVIQELRNMYYSNKSIEPIKCDIAIHIRRGDVGCLDVWGKKDKDGNIIRHWTQRYNTNDEYLKIIGYIRETYEKNKKIAIFSQGKKEDFQDLLIDENIELHLDECHWSKAYHSLVESPILITSISEFAWTAGLLSKGIIYRNERMFRWPLKKWLKLPFLEKYHQAPSISD